MGAVSNDGSWAVAAKGANGKTYAQWGPQDDLYFPTTFYECFIETDDGVSVHFFSEPGMPLNQFYMVNHGYVLGRNRGYGYCNDYLHEPSSRTSLHHVAVLKLRNGTAVDVPVYRSVSGGWVMERNDQHALTLRSAFLGEDIRGLNQLSSVFFTQNLTGFLKLFGPEYQVRPPPPLFPQRLKGVTKQSPVLHSHLELAANDVVGAALNGLLTNLPEDYDRRFPLSVTAHNDTLPSYTIVTPRWQLGRKPQYFSWNTPFDRELPWTSDYHYGGWWRSEWIARWFAMHPLPDMDEVLQFPRHMAAANALQLAGSGDHDQFAAHMWPLLKVCLWLLPPPPLLLTPPHPEEYVSNTSLYNMLDTFQGHSFDNIAANDYSDAYVLANSWLYAMIEALFVPAIGRDAPIFALPDVRDQRVPLPQNHPARRFASLVVLLLNDTTRPLLHFDWLKGRTLASLASSTLAASLDRLGPSPWGVGLRPNFTMIGVGGVLGVVGSMPAAQLPSANVAVQIGACGIERVDSSIPFGVSGLVSSGRIFAPHSLDQWALYSSYTQKEAPRLFAATLACLEAQSNHTMLIVGISVGAFTLLVFGVMVGVWCRRKNRPRGQYLSLRG
jgi:hypothetical protein